MRMQSLHTTIPALFLMAVSCTSSKHIEFLVFEGCPNTPELRRRLVEANPTIHIVDVDLMALNSGDSRLGWGAPTILVHGKDLFGMKPSAAGNVSCRNWESGLPSIDNIKEALEAQP